MGQITETEMYIDEHTLENFIERIYSQVEQFLSNMILPVDYTTRVSFVIVTTGMSNSNINPYLTNGFSHHCQLGESTFIFRGVRSDF